MNFTCSKVMCAVATFCLGISISASAQQFTKLVDFNGSNGIHPEYTSITQGADGNFYGTTYKGGAHNDGTIFRTTPAGTLTTLHSFSFADGALPVSGLTLAMDGNFYGTTWLGGISGSGTFFRVSSAGLLVSHSLCPLPNCTDGVQPYAGLFQATNGSLYGTTEYGGTKGYGTVFSITLAGTLMTLHSFDQSDGSVPVAEPIQGIDGNLYGTTYQGGSLGAGTIFRMTPEGVLTTLHNFDGYTGSGPLAGLVQAVDGNFYGATYVGGANNAGTVFTMTPDGVVTTLHSFDFSDGANPYAAPLLATDGNLYGTTGAGGAYGHGTVFKMTPGGRLITLHTFRGDDGGEPVAVLIQSTNGNLYGTTYAGGKYNHGTVFTLSAGLGPFVTFVRAAGKVGQTGGILGQGFTGVTSVSFNGTPAPFTVESDTFILSTVPVGATTGYVTVTTPGGTLTSNVPFQVIP